MISKYVQYAIDYFEAHPDEKSFEFTFKMNGDKCTTTLDDECDYNYIRYINDTGSYFSFLFSAIYFNMSNAPMCFVYDIEIEEYDYAILEVGGSQINPDIFTFKHPLTTSCSCRGSYKIGSKKAV